MYDHDDIDTDHDDDSDYDSDHERNLPHELDGLKQTNVVGTPAQDAQHWQMQNADYNCVPQNERGIFEAMTGIPATELDFTTEAAQHGAMTMEDGTQQVDVGQLLAHHGIPVHQVEHGNLSDLLIELGEGHKIIVGVNGDQLHGDHPLHELLSDGESNHAIWLTGIDKSDPDHIKVYVNDSADPEGAGKCYALEDFMHAWEGSDFFYMATDNPPDDSVANVPLNTESGAESYSGAFKEVIDWVSDHVSVGDMASAITSVGMAVQAARLGQSVSTASTPQAKLQSKKPLPRTVHTRQRTTASIPAAEDRAVQTTDESNRPVCAPMKSSSGVELGKRYERAAPARENGTENDQRIEAMKARISARRKHQQDAKRAHLDALKSTDKYDQYQDSPEPDKSDNVIDLNASKRKQHG